MAKHTLELDDLELTALMTYLQGQSEIMVESRLNSNRPDTPDREELILNMVYANVFTLAYKADQNPNSDYNIIENQDRIYKYKDT